MTSVTGTLEVSLKVTDLVARTAEMAIRDKLMLGGCLLGLARRDVWVVEAEVEELDRFAGSLDRETARDGRYYNLHKHDYRLTLSEADHTLRRGNPLSDGFGGKVPQAIANKAYLVIFRVQDPDAETGPAELERLNFNIDGGRILAMVRCLDWRLALSAPSEADARRLAEDIAITRGRRQGILVNPHYQDHRVLCSRPIQPVGQDK